MTRPPIWWYVLMLGLVALASCADIRPEDLILPPIPLGVIIW